MAVLANPLNARQRKNVYMHSTIFDENGPKNNSVYRPDRQLELHEGLQGTIRRNNQAPPELVMPSAADMKCTQNSGQGVVLPSNRPHHQPILSGQSPRTTDREHIVADGVAAKVLRAQPHKHNQDQIPKEMWATSVKLEWHDPRNEMIRRQGNSNMSAQELKMNELSSSMFGKERLVEKSTENPRQELMADTAHVIGFDSSICPSHERSLRSRDANPGSQGGAQAKSKFYKNLGASESNAMKKTTESCESSELPPAVTDEDSANLSRRRQEKNFSDIFGVQQGTRQAIKHREEIIGARNCSFLDTRAEIANRNKNKWKHSDVAAFDRKEAMLQSTIFDRECPSRPPVSTEDKQLDTHERVFWDSKEFLHSGAEIARRHRMKDHHLPDDPEHDGVSAGDRKQTQMSSDQVRRGMGIQATPVSPRTLTFAPSPRQGRINATAKDTKIAFLQSSIFS